MNTKANFIVILMMLCFLSFYSCSLLQQNSSELNAVITEMINNKESFRTGKSEQYGAYIIYITEIERDEKLPDREIVELAFAEGKKKIAEYIGTNFSASESAESLQNNDVLQESFISHIHVDTNQFLRGISLYRFDEIRKNKVRAVVLATEQTQKMISDIKQKMDSVPSDYTASSGFAYIINDRRDQAHEQAIHAALRSAIEQVLGTTVVGHEKVSNINGDITARSRILLIQMDLLKNIPSQKIPNVTDAFLYPFMPKFLKINF